MYSFAFCYRNREEHLNITIPWIKELYPDSEIIIVEQNDQKKFRRANLLNEGAKAASHDIVIFHDIDYFPTKTVEYWDGKSDVFLPVKFVDFVYNSLRTKPIEEVPGGYRHFRNGVDDNFFGGVCTFKKDKFFAINGFSPLYVGWGFEEGDLRERVKSNNLSVARSTFGRFLALDHPDSGPSMQDQDFIRNIQMSQQWFNYVDKGVRNQPSKIEEITPRHPLVDKWIMATEFDGPSNIVASSYNWDE